MDSRRKERGKRAPGHPAKYQQLPATPAEARESLLEEYGPEKRRELDERIRQARVIAGRLEQVTEHLLAAREHVRLALLEILDETQLRELVFGRVGAQPDFPELAHLPELDAALVQALRGVHRPWRGAKQRRRSEKPLDLSSALIAVVSDLKWVKGTDLAMLAIECGVEDSPWKHVPKDEPKAARDAFNKSANGWHQDLVQARKRREQLAGAAGMKGSAKGSAAARWRYLTTEGEDPGLRELPPDWPPGKA